jgi:hypothetical protein
MFDFQPASVALQEHGEEEPELDLDFLMKMSKSVDNLMKKMEENLKRGMYPNITKPYLTLHTLTNSKT